MVAAQNLAEQRVDLYYALAEALVDIPVWLMFPGREWPLTRAAISWAPHAPITQAMAQIPAEAEEVRRQRYTQLFSGPGQPRFWLYESMWCSGRFLGPEARALEQVYGKAGMSVAGAEAPDHAAVELAFLAHLSEQRFKEPEFAPGWARLEEDFIRKHAGQWLPDLGHSLAATGDEVYGPIGALLAGLLSAPVQPRRKRWQASRRHSFPLMENQELCTLCGFCVQVCPPRALVIQENHRQTMLKLTKSMCNGCRKCIRSCPAGVLRMNDAGHISTIPVAKVVLRQSPRVDCPGCGTATVSRAELDFVAEQIGRPDWLTYCLPCRSSLWEKNHECAH